MPTVSTKSTFITATIAANEHRLVRCYDIPSAFMNTDMDEDVLMVLKGELAEMMVQIAPQVYRNNVTVDRKGDVQADKGEITFLQKTAEGNGRIWL